MVWGDRGGEGEVLRVCRVDVFLCGVGEVVHGVCGRYGDEVMWFGCDSRGWCVGWRETVRVGWRWRVWRALWVVKVFVGGGDGREWWEFSTIVCEYAKV